MSNLDGLDIVALCGLDWVYDRVESRYGRVVAFVAALTLGFAILAGLVAALIAVM